MNLYNYLLNIYIKDYFFIIFTPFPHSLSFLQSSPCAPPCFFSHPWFLFMNHFYIHTCVCICVCVYAYIFLNTKYRLLYLILVLCMLSGMRVWDWITSWFALSWGRLYYTIHRTYYTLKIVLNFREVVFIMYCNLSLGKFWTRESESSLVISC